MFDFFDVGVWQSSMSILLFGVQFLPEKTKSFIPSSGMKQIFTPRFHPYYAFHKQKASLFSADNAAVTSCFPFGLSHALRGRYQKVFCKGASSKRWRCTFLWFAKSTIWLPLQRFWDVLFILIFMLPPKLGIVNTIFLTSLLITDKMNMYHSCFIRMWR